MQRIREELLEVVVVPSDLHFSNIGARVASGGPCKRDGAPIQLPA